MPDTAGRIESLCLAICEGEHRVTEPYLPPLSVQLALLPETKGKSLEEIEELFTPAGQRGYARIN